MFYSVVDNIESKNGGQHLDACFIPDSGRHMRYPGYVSMKG